MKAQIRKGSTSKCLLIKIPDSESSTGAGRSGILYNSAGLVAYYLREGASAPVSITLAPATLGSYSAGGLVEVPNMPGWYQLCPPDAAFATGADTVGIQLRGAPGMGDVDIEIQLIDLAISGGCGELAGVPGATPTIQEMIQFLFQLGAFPLQSTSSQQKMMKRDGATVLGTAALSDDGTTFSKGAVS